MIKTEDPNCTFTFGVTDPSWILKLIKTCKASGVKEFKFGELELTFQAGEAVKRKGEPTKLLDDEELNNAQQLAEKIAHTEAIENDLATLQIEDPQEYERLLIERELEFAPGTAEASQDQ